MIHMDLQPILENDLVLLRPLRETDREALFAVASDPLVWEQHPDKSRCERDGFNRFFDAGMASGGALLVLSKETGEVMGSSRYYPARGHAHKIEIGWTFLARRYWGGPYNRSVKELMLQHAFQYVDAVLFYIDRHNFRSQKAVEKLGAVPADPIAENLEIKSAGNMIYLLTRQHWSKPG